MRSHKLYINVFRIRFKVFLLICNRHYAVFSIEIVLNILQLWKDKSGGLSEHWEGNHGNPTICLQMWSNGINITNFTTCFKVKLVCPWHHCLERALQRIPLGLLCIGQILSHQHKVVVSDIHAEIFLLSTVQVLEIKCATLWMVLEIVMMLLCIVNDAYMSNES